jgi:Flp pilus assembly CpaE family ATPase
MMIKKTVTVLLIEDSVEYAELVRRWLSPQDDMEFVVHRTDSLCAGLSRLDAGDIDAILLDLGLPDSRGIETFTTAKMHAGGIPILILSGSDMESVALQTIQQGAEDYYIMKSSCDGALLVKALRHAVGRAAPRVVGDTASDQGTVIGVMGVKGGVGVTTFACNLALELRCQTQQRALVADLNVNAGLVSFLMKADAEHSIFDAANAHRLDQSYWDGIVAHAPGGVDIMPSPNLLGMDVADISKIQEVFATIRMFYRWTVLDLGRLANLSLSLLDKVSTLYLVTTVSVPALYEAKRTIGVLMRAGLEPDRLRLVVNQVGSAEYSGNELSRLFGVPVHARLPNAARELDDACSRGQVLGANSEYRVQVAEVARRIAGLPEGVPGGAAAHFWSFADRFRKNSKDVALATRT